MKIYLCRYQNNAAVIVAKGVGDARSAVVTALGDRWNQGVDDRKQIQCREVKGVQTIHPIEPGDPVLLQSSKS